MPDKIKPLRNIRLTIEYDGTNYCGWQVQKSHKVTRSQSHKSIQEVIEKALRRILQEKVKLIASGRTDAGVHALAQVVNFKAHSAIPAEKLQKALNALLPEDIVITQAKETGLDFHSRFQARSKIYRYTILNRDYPCAFLRNRAYLYPQPLDIKLMQRESRVLLGRHNFKSFQASDKRERDPVRLIKKLKITRSKNLIYIDIEADGFLYNMVRNIVGTLIEIGRHRFAKGKLKKILLSADRRLAGPLAPAHGLCLVRVNY
ncbi:MAG: tRNA pseudouridine(38-40) synthase TruA [Candidatus Omnitrophota bacterium]|nr:tRNA pseudouridine(38-40) synthase TruA [Candidatus Omnitrophota bacterium]